MEPCEQVEVERANDRDDAPARIESTGEPLGLRADTFVVVCTPLVRGEQTPCVALVVTEPSHPVVPLLERDTLVDEDDALPDAPQVDVIEILYDAVDEDCDEWHDVEPQEPDAPEAPPAELWYDLVEDDGEDWADGDHWCDDADEACWDVDEIWYDPVDTEPRRTPTGVVTAQDDRSSAGGPVPRPPPSLYACTIPILLWACSGGGPPDGVDGIEGPASTLFAEGGEPGQYEGILTLDEYDWFSVTTYLGVIRVDLATGGKRRFLDGRHPWMHPSGNTVFIQPCGQNVGRVALADARGLFEVITPCSSEIEAPGYTAPNFEFVKLSPDQTRVAVETRYFVDSVVYSTIVFENGEEIARFDGLFAPEWLSDGRLLLGSSEGLFLTNRALTDVSRIDDAQLNGFVNNPAIHPDGERIVFEFNQRIWEIHLDGTNLQERVYSDRALRYPAWSPDGSSIAYLGVAQQDYYDRAIYFTDLDRLESTFLDLNPVLSGNVSVVPNGPLSWR